MIMSARRSYSWILFAVSALAAIGAFFFIFELRYMWYVSNEEFMLLRMIEAVGIGLILVLWLLYPSRIAIVAVGIAALSCPSFMPSKGSVPLDGAFIVWLCAAAAMLLVATQLNIKARLQSAAYEK